MQIRNTPERFCLPAQLLHWLTALFMRAAWLLGTFDDAFPRGAPRQQALLLHFSFGRLTIPPLIGADRALGRSIKGVHELLGNLMLVLVGLHALAALRHHFILRDTVLRRVLPFRPAAAPPSPRR